MISLKEFKSSDGSGDNAISALIGKLFEARDFAHQAHLRTKSYAQHKALGSFYDDVIGLADSLYETYAGQYGQFKFSVGQAKDEDPVKYMESLGKFLSEAHEAIDKKDTHLHNILDEIVGLVYQTNYKLKFLK
jgi:hypothetical protein